MSENDPHEPQDTATFSMFSDAETGAQVSSGYQVLARKYRPRRFEDLIGQEAMVRTLTNAFRTDRIAHAFMLTGVRGVGKTTTARLLARALNYRTDETDRPSIRLDPVGEHCAAIMAGQHPDVLELDAASRTGVQDMRDLLDGARYAPASARFKVYVIDEVHMLSIQAFNALLKTLEEPPAHVKFIFATTEIRKVPVTVLSRCQRFDLKRLDAGQLAEHLHRVAEREGTRVSDEGLALIARAAEGSVRDALSILDQALVQAPADEAVSGERVRDMLGLGDRMRLFDLFEAAVKGDGPKVIAELAEQIAAGADPLIVLRDLLDICADISSAQVTGEDWSPAQPSDWIARTRALSQCLSPAQAARVWQILLAGHRDTQTAPDTAVSARMVLLRLVAGAGLPSPEDAARMLLAGASQPAAPAQAAPASDPGSGPQSFSELVERLHARREAVLLGEVEQHIKPVSLSPGHLVCALKPGASENLIRRLARFLEDDTGLAWTIDLTDEGGETFQDRAARIRAEKIAAVSAHPSVQAALAALPGAEIVGVCQESPVEPDGDRNNVIPLQRRG